MEYIIFLVTIQTPFLYLIWKIFQKQTGESTRLLRNLKRQGDHTANFMDTLRLSVEKISEDIYGNGKVNARMFEIEREIKKLQENFRQMELYTGLSTKNRVLEEISSSSALKEKDFR